MRIIFMGTPDFAVPILDRLLRFHDVPAVVTQPDKPKGRGKQILFSPVKRYALEKNLAVMQPARVKDGSFIEAVQRYAADIFVVAAYGQILPESLLAMPKYGAVNVHGSLLPKYRGAAPVQWAVIDGETTTGVTVMQMDKGLDTGDMLLQKSFAIAPEDTGGIVFDKMAEIGAVALTDALLQIENGTVVRTKQDGAQASYAKMITKQTGRIDWTARAADIVNLIRALDPWPSAYTDYDGKPLKLWHAKAVADDTVSAPGTILTVDKDKGFTVKTGDAALLVTAVQAVGGKRMPVSDYLRGHRIEPGKILL